MLKKKLDIRSKQCMTSRFSFFLNCLLEVTVWRKLMSVHIRNIELNTTTFISLKILIRHIRCEISSKSECRTGPGVCQYMRKISPTFLLHRDRAQEGG